LYLPSSQGRVHGAASPDSLVDLDAAGPAREGGGPGPAAPCVAERQRVALELVDPPKHGGAGRIQRQVVGPGLAAIAGMAGGTVGAWAGVAVYRWVNVADEAIFDACVLGGLLLGAIPLGWLMAGQKATAAGGGGSVGKPIYGIGCGVAIAGALLSCSGNVLHSLASPPFGFVRLDENFKVVGVFVILGGLVALVLGLLGVRRTRGSQGR
jgi:hypothetical protein